MTDARTDPGRGEELGGRSPIRVLLQTGRDVAGAFATVADAVAARTGGAIEAQISSDPDSQADIVVLSLADAVDKWTAAPTSSGAAAAESWREEMRAICSEYKSKGTRVFVCNASTVVPDDHRSTYRDVPETPSVFANRLDAALIELSISEGISIIDVDGLVAQAGAEEHVVGVMTYSDHVLQMIGDELVYVIEDYGFFHPRPLLPQRGRGAA